MKTILNEDVVWSRYELGIDFFEEYLEYFRSHSGEIYAKLTQALDKKDMVEVARFAHDLKGLCFNLGLERFAAHLKAMETLSAEGAVDALQSHLNELPELSKQAMLALETYRDKQEC